jgi:hypothetical protein
MSGICLKLKTRGAFFSFFCGSVSVSVCIEFAQLIVYCSKGQRTLNKIKFEIMPQHTSLEVEGDSRCFVGRINATS